MSGVRKLPGNYGFADKSISARKAEKLASALFQNNVTDEQKQSMKVVCVRIKYKIAEMNVIETYRRERGGTLLSSSVADEAKALAQDLM